MNKKIKCIDQLDSNTTIGKIYDVIDENSTYYTFKPDIGVSAQQFKWRFEEVGDNVPPTGVQKIIHSGSVTIVILDDGRIGVSICHKDAVNDPQVGFAVAFTKAHLGSKAFREQAVEREPVGFEVVEASRRWKLGIFDIGSMYTHDKLRRSFNSLKDWDGGIQSAL